MLVIVESTHKHLTLEVECWSSWSRHTNTSHWRSNVGHRGVDTQTPHIGGRMLVIVESTHKHLTLEVACWSSWSRHTNTSHWRSNVGDRGVDTQTPHIGGRMLVIVESTHKLLTLEVDCWSSWSRHTNSARTDIISPRKGSVCGRTATDQIRIGSTVGLKLLSGRGVNIRIGHDVKRLVVVGHRPTYGISHDFLRPCSHHSCETGTSRPPRDVIAAKRFRNG